MRSEFSSRGNHMEKLTRQLSLPLVIQRSPKAIHRTVVARAFRKLGWMITDEGYVWGPICKAYESHNGEPIACAKESIFYGESFVLKDEKEIWERTCEEVSRTVTKEYRLK